MLTFSNFSFDAGSGVVQFHTEDLGRPRVSLKLCIAAGQNMFVLGTAEEPIFYEAEAIIRGLLEGGSEFDLPLPAPLPFPEVLKQFSDDDLGLILDAALGLPAAALTARAGSRQLLEEFIIRVHTLGFAIRGATAVGPLEKKIAAELIERKREIAHNQRLNAAADMGQSVEQVNEPEKGFFVIDRAPEALLRQLESRGKSAYEAKTRMSWGFSNMQIGDRMTVPANLAKRGQTAVHVYAARVGRRFHTTTSRISGNLTVVRIADRATTKPSWE
jgi:hypothetical protein